MAGWIKMPLCMEVGLGPDDFVLDGDPAPPLQKGDRAPKFSAHVYCGQTARWIKMAIGMEVSLGPAHIVLDGDPAPAPLPKRGQCSPNFRPMSTVAKRLDGWIKVPLGTEVDLDPGDIVLNGDPVPAQNKMAQPSPIFGSCLLWPNGCMCDDITW